MKVITVYILNISTNSNMLLRKVMEKTFAIAFYNDLVIKKFGRDKKNFVLKPRTVRQ